MSKADGVTRQFFRLMFEDQIRGINHTWSSIEVWRMPQNDTFYLRFIPLRLVRRYFKSFVTSRATCSIRRRTHGQFRQSMRQQGINFLFRDDYGRTALHYAAASGSGDV